MTGDDDGSGGQETAHGGRPCPLCGEPLYKRHCKYVCEQHGVIMDCSDPFYL
ncbi:HVO_2523 family zinc finger protein [Haloarchaeobius sp. TZWWS8]|uniref:HVO_2523 family zinc finger protein n=1 Tax=Haloarchaeobius sp. TZWWS8 TaxID=3446121 RepID=UPI003EC09A9E